MTYTEMQLGKNGITDNFIKTLKNGFTFHENVRISVLKSAGHARNKVKEYEEEILNKMGNRYTARKIGFTIVVKKWRKAPVKKK
jgi:RNA-binding protein YhbY